MAQDEHIKMIARNKRALRDYTIEDRFEAGIVLVGSEVKSLRDGKVTLAGSHLRIQGNEAFALGIEIPEYAHANRFNHEVDRARKLLLHRREIERLRGKINQQGFTLVPMKLYFSQGKVKLQIGLGKGKKHYDKRQDTKQRDAKRDMQRAKRRER